MSTAASASTSNGWSQARGGAARPGVSALAPDPPYSQAWPSSFRVAPELNLGVSEPVIAGDIAVTVAPRAVIGVSLSTGTQAWTIDRTFGPSVPAAIASDASGRQILVYTEGFGATPLPIARASASASAAGTILPSASSSVVASASASPASGDVVPSTLPADEQPRVVAVDLATRMWVGLGALYLVPLLISALSGPPRN